MSQSLENSATALRLVILEDDEGMVELVRRRLVREGGHECFCFVRAEEALEWLAANQADLAIIDMVLPGWSGEQFVAAMRERGIEIPFIVATGQGSEATAVSMLKKGARDYLVKNSELLKNLPAVVNKVWNELQLERFLARAREKIQEQNDVLSAINEFSPDGIMVVDENDRIVSHNPQLLSFCGIESGDIPASGAGMFQLMAENSRNPRRILDATAALPPDAGGMIIDDIMVNGHHLEVFSKRVKMHARDGGGEGRVWYFQDVTLHREAQAKMEEARKEAERNTRMRTQFFALVSHEVKTPLNSIVGFADLLAASELDDHQQDYLRALKSSSAHLLALINDILDLSRIEHGAMQLNIEPFSLRESLGELVQSFLPQSRQKGLELSLEIAAETPDEMRGDYLRFRQVLINLIGNAVKFTERGSIKVGCEPAGGAAVRVRVADTGIGIDPDAQAVLFTPFSQASSSISKKYGGTGLGLAIAKQLVERFGGSIELRSAPGDGSTFTLEIPLVCPAEKPASHEEAP